jgi:hypothetical protein
MLKWINIDGTSLSWKPNNFAETNNLQSFADFVSLSNIYLTYFLKFQLRQVKKFRNNKIVKANIIRKEVSQILNPLSNIFFYIPAEASQEVPEEQKGPLPEEGRPSLARRT